MYLENSAVRMVVNCMLNKLVLLISLGWLVGSVAYYVVNNFYYRVVLWGSWNSYFVWIFYNVKVGFDAYLG